MSRHPDMVHACLVSMVTEESADTETEGRMTGLDILEQQAREKIEAIRRRNDFSDGGFRMMREGEHEREQQELREAHRTLELIAVARADLPTPKRREG